tara:strand:+ start:82 stop:423 length:342 start_codon:yes stop_codon:yes gene_type:complete
MIDEFETSMKSYVKYEYDHDEDCIYVETNISPYFGDEKVCEDLSNMLHSISNGSFIEDTAKSMISYGINNNTETTVKKIMTKWKQRIISDKEKDPYVSPVNVFEFRKAGDIGG